MNEELIEEDGICWPKKDFEEGIKEAQLKLFEKRYIVGFDPIDENDEPSKVTIFDRKNNKFLKNE